jgi:Zn-dependent protease with chaperone function
MKPLAGAVAAVLAGAVAVGCASPVTSRPPGPTTQTPAPTRTQTAGRPLDARDAERLRRVMTPLVRAMNNPRALSDIKIGIMDDPHINAANAGGGEFFVTRGLLEKANDQQLLGVLAHEVAHEDLHHVAKAQTLGAGLNIGMLILDQILPGSGALTPIAGQLIARGYSRKEEYDADQHGADLLQRIGSSKQVMIDTLQWLIQNEGSGSGGFFATHPATGDRIEALRNGR